MGYLETALRILTAQEARKRPVRGRGRELCEISELSPPDDSWRGELALASPSFREWWEERAAIREFDGGLPRAVAEREAYGDVMRALGRDLTGDWAVALGFDPIDPDLFDVLDGAKGVQP